MKASGRDESQGREKQFADRFCDIFSISKGEGGLTEKLEKARDDLLEKRVSCQAC